MAACSGTQDEVERFKHSFTEVSAWFLVAIVAFEVIVTIGATIYIYTMRKFSQVPLFVTV